MLRASHRRRRRGTRLVLLLAIVVCVTAVADFGYNAYQNTTDSPLSYDWGAARWTVSWNGTHARSASADLDLRLQLDAMVIMLALPVVLGTSVKLAKIPHRRKRFVLCTEAVVVILLVVSGVQWTLWEHPDGLGTMLGKSKDERPAVSYEMVPHAYWPPEMTIAGDTSPYRN
jgi:hypothetical protein